MGPIGIPEIIIVVLIVCVLFGPKLFKKIGKAGKDLGQGAKKGLENGLENAGVDAKVEDINGDTIMKGINKMQDRVDKMFEDIDEDGKPIEKPAKAEASDDEAPKEEASK